MADGFTLKDEASRVKHLGSLRVNVAHENITGNASKGNYNANAASGGGIMSEKALKGQSLSHMVE